MDLTILGSTGLIGSFVLKYSCEDSCFASVKTIVRREQAHVCSKHQSFLSNNESLVEAFASKVCVCALGTTIKKAGSQEAFKKVDYDLIIDYAKLAKGHGVEHFIVVSSLGASSSSANFYLRTKGETEQALKGVGFKKLSIVRPSLLLGDRNEFRLGETIGGKLFPIMNLALNGRLKKYRAIEAKDVARAIIQLAKDEQANFPPEIVQFT